MTHYFGEMTEDLNGRLNEHYKKNVDGHLQAPDKNDSYFLSGGLMDNFPDVAL